MPLIKTKKELFGKNSNDGYDNDLDEIDVYKILNTTDFELRETNSSFHFELKLPGYIKEDFSFYISNGDLVVTTRKSKIKEAYNMASDKNTRHSYCYPSAYFKRRFQLPKNIVRDTILVDYKDGILSFDLLKVDHKDSRF
jgi:HSP20 family molecular chaperone IbpA